MDIQNKLDQRIHGAVHIKRIHMSPEAYVKLRKTLFRKIGSVIIDNYEDVPIVIDYKMIGEDDWYI